MSSKAGGEQLFFVYQGQPRLDFGPPEDLVNITKLFRLIEFDLWTTKGLERDLVALRRFIVTSFRKGPEAFWLLFVIMARLFCGRYARAADHLGIHRGIALNLARVSRVLASGRIRSVANRYR